MRPTVKLWEIAKVSAWNSAPQDENFFKNWKYPFYRTADVWKVHYSRNLTEVKDYLNEEWIKWLKLYKKWTILFPKSWASTFLNHRVIMGQDWYVVSHLATISVNKDADENFVYYYLTTVDAKDLCADQWYPSLKSSNIAEVEIPLPPLETQKAIVAKLDQIFAELDQTKSEIQKNLDNTDELWKSALNQAFQGDWEMKKLWEVCDKVDNVKWRDNISYKYIDLTSVDRDYWNIYDTKIINSKTAPSRAKQIVKYNDILFWTTRPTQLRRCIIPIEYDNQICSTWFCVIRLKKNLIPSYLYFLLETQSFFDYVEKYQSWAGYPAISDKKLKEFCIPVLPLSEQEKIVEHLDQVSKEVKALKSQYQSQLDNLEELKKSVLDKAFRWELGE